MMFKTSSGRSIFGIFLAAGIVGFLLFFVLLNHAQASPTPEDHELAAIASKIEVLRRLIGALTDSLFRGGFAQVSGSCPAGYHFMSYTSTYPNGYCQSDTSTSTCQPTGGGTTFTCPTTTTTTTTSCSSSLTALLGSGCHYMYSGPGDGRGPIYCDGPMTKSAREGDTTTTNGCSSSTTTTYRDCAGLYGTGWHTMDSSGNCFDSAMQNYRTVNGTLYSCTSFPAYGCSSTTSTAPPTPGGFTATVSGSSITLNWVDVSGETQYKIWRQQGGTWSYLTSVGANIISYTDASLVAGTYNYYLKACNGETCSTTDAQLNGPVTIGSADTTPPSIPTGLSATAPSSSQVALTWNASTDNVGVASYKVFRNNVVSTTFPASSFTTSVINYSDGNVTAATTYSYAVSAIDAAGNESPPSSSVSVTTPSAGGTTSTIPSPPTGLSASVVTAGSVNLSWFDVTGETEYKVYRRSSPSGAWTNILTASLGANVTAYTDSSAPAGTYDYHVNACNSAGCSGDSNWVTATVSTGGTTPAGQKEQIWNSLGLRSWIRNDADPARITQLQQSCNNVPSGSSVWLPGSGNSTSVDFGMPDPVKCQRAASCTSGQYFDGSSCVPSGTTTTSCGSSLIALLGSGCHWMYGGTADGRGPIYCDGPMTKSAREGDTVTTLGCSAPNTGTATAVPVAPTNLSAVQSQSDAVLTWYDNSTNESEYRIERRTTGGTSWTNIGVTGFFYSGSGTYRDYAPPPASYDYRVKACNSVGCSADSNIMLLLISSTPTVPPTGGIPAAPSGLTAAVLANGRDVNLRWIDNANNEDSHKVWRRVSGSWSFLTSFPVSSGAGTNYFDYGVPSGSVDYQVQACNTSGCSPDSNIASVNIGGPTATTTTVTYPFRFPGSGKTCNSYQECFDYCKTAPGSGTGDSATCDQYFPGATRYTSSCPSGFHVMNDYAGSSYGTSGGYCMSDSNSSICQPLGGGATYTCPGTVGPQACDTALIALLGQGCHYMYNDYSGNPIFCDANMVKSAKRGDTVTSPGCQAGGPTPIPVAFSVDYANTSPRSGEWGLSGLTHIRVKFTKEIDLTSTISQFFSLAPTSDPSVTTLQGTFQFFGDRFEFVPNVPLQPNTTYVYKVLATLKDKSGTALSSPFSATFTTGGGEVVTSGTIEGSVKDENGAPLAGVPIQVSKDNYYGSNIGTVSSSDGLFRVVVAPGTYLVEVYTPAERRDSARPLPVKVTVAAGGKELVAFKFGGSPKAISGSIKFSSGTAVSDAEVGAYSQDTGQWRSTTVDSGGNYTLRVGGGRWIIGIRPVDPSRAQWSYNDTLRQTVSFSKSSSSEYQIIDFTVQPADSTLKVSTVDGDGKALIGVGVVVDTFGAIRQVGDVAGQAGQPQYRSSDSSGIATFTLASSRYFVRSYLPPEKGFLNPPEQEVSVGSGKSVDAKLVFKKRDVSSAVALKGLVKLEDGVPADAFVWAWSEKGGYMSTYTSSNGTFEYKAGTNDRWHLGAGKAVNGIPYKSSDITVDIKDTGVFVELILTKLSAADLPPPVVQKESAAKQIVAQTDDGAKASIPPQAAASSGTISVEVKPTVEAPSQAAAQVVSTVYDVDVRDSAGQNITQLNDYIEITIPYDEKELKSKGVSEDSIIPSYFDEKTGAWVKVESYTIDKDRNVVVCRVKHLTRFGLVASTDTTPPESPTKVLAAALGGGKIKISWTNPTRDFSHAKVYRSDKQGELGRLIAAKESRQEFTDESIIDGIIYYYTVRSVDAAGNESNNTNQVYAKAVGTSSQFAPAAKTAGAMAQGKKAGALSKNLSQGVRGDDVKALQELLIKEGLLPAGSSSGFYGKLTKEAVMKFQEKYAADILKPAGLTKGNGFVGTGTRKKINELLKY